MNHTNFEHKGIAHEEMFQSNHSMVNSMHNSMHHNVDFGQPNSMTVERELIQMDPHMSHSNMDHVMDHQIQGHSMPGHSMTFHGGYAETILFSWWKVTEKGQFAGSFFAIFIIAILYEGLKYYRKHLLWKTYAGLQYCAVAPPDKGIANACAPDDPQIIQPVSHTLESNVPSMTSGVHIWQTILHGLQVLISYMLMLVFMTYNVWLCAAVVLGSATGYFLFGWRESVVVDFTEHCH